MTDATTAEDGAPWVLPAEIPFDTLLGKDLEECVYWLLDAMGAKDLEWRVGGTGGGAADGGRDLEAVFYAPSADGDMIRQRWWVECKGRSKTLEADQVKAALNNALAEADLDHIVIATNTTFTNPTRDWVARWQVTHPRPKVQLWDRPTLERLLSRQPQVVLRLFAQALSLEGRIKAAEERFWGRLEFVSPKTLAAFWAKRGEVEIGGLARFALIASEFAIGSIAERPWAAGLDTPDLSETLQMAVLNIPYLMRRAQLAGQATASLTRARAYLVLAILQAHEPDAVAALLHLLTSGDADSPYPDNVREVLLLPIIARLLDEMRDVCSSDCHRFYSTRSTLRTEDGDEIENYWWRLEPKGRPHLEDPRSNLHLENTRGPCKVGFALNDEVTCPLFGADITLDNVAETLATLAKVASFRREEAKVRLAEKAAEIARFNAGPLRRKDEASKAEPSDDVA